MKIYGNGDCINALIVEDGSRGSEDGRDVQKSNSEQRSY